MRGRDRQAAAVALGWTLDDRSYCPGVFTAILAAAALIGCSSDGTADAPASMPVVLDYSPTVSDAGALLYLAANPSVDLLAVTLPGTGEADCLPGARTTRALLEVAGDADVPVGCGRDTPLAGDRDWPEEWRAEANTWGNDVLPMVADQPTADAEQLLVDTLTASAAPVTIVAVGPLTNLGAVLGDRPDLVERIDRIVVMGGAVNVPGNVETAPAAEWNFYVDPEAARRVLAAGVQIVLIPLDATNQVPWTASILQRLGTLDGASARAEHDMVSSRSSLDGVYLWDELAAVATVRPDLVTLDDVLVRITDDGAVQADADGTAVRVAVDAEPVAVIDEFMRTLNGGSLPAEAAPTATAAELGWSPLDGHWMTVHTADVRADT